MVYFGAFQAYTIRSLHRGKSGAAAAKKKSLALLYSIIVVFVFKVMTGYAPGIVRPVAHVNSLSRQLNTLRFMTGTSAGHFTESDSPA